ncbi:MAG: hypothetical protein N2C14_30050 [Planctomycetales bacterium]
MDADPKRYTEAGRRQFNLIQLFGLMILVAVCLAIARPMPDERVFEYIFDAPVPQGVTITHSTYSASDAIFATLEMEISEETLDSLLGKDWAAAPDYKEEVYLFGDPPEEFRISRPTNNFVIRVGVGREDVERVLVHNRKTGRVYVQAVEQ